MDEFELEDDDSYAIELATRVARRLLRLPKVTPAQIIGLGRALDALERLPVVTDGAQVSFGIEYRVASGDDAQMRYITISISDDTFEIASGGSVYTAAVGADTDSDPGYRIEIGGYREDAADLRSTEDRVAEFLNLGAEVVVDDQSSGEEVAD